MSIKISKTITTDPILSSTTSEIEDQIESLFKSGKILDINDYIKIDPPIEDRIEDKKIEKSIKEQVDQLKDDVTKRVSDSKEQIGQINTYVIGIAIVAGLAAIGWIADSIWFHIDTIKEIQNLRIENQQLKNDIKNIHDDMELLVEKKYSEILKTQITPKTGIPK